MFAELGTKVNLRTTLSPVGYYMKRPARLIRTYDRSNLRPDLIAGITVAVIALPQGIAFALIAELPPQMGLYAVVVGAIVGALWGSSSQIHNGPANAMSLLVFSSLSAVVVAGSPEFAVAAGLLAIMVGVFQLIMGLARLGMLVNFVSHSVIVGFANGAGVLIAIKQLRPLLGLTFSSHDIWETFRGLFTHLPDTNVLTLALGIGTMVIIVMVRKLNSKLPAALLSMILASVAVYAFGLIDKGVDVIGQLDATLPPLRIPIVNLDLISKLSAGALAVGAIGLVQTTAIARSMATQTGQRLDNNQEFVGQGMANIFMGLFSGYPGASSFSRTAVNYKAGAASPGAAIFSGLFVLIAMFTLAPLAAYLPRSALAGVLIVTAYGMIDREEIKRIWHSHPGDAAIMLLTLLGTLFLEIEFAVLAGIIVSLALYILRTSTPRVHAVLPDNSFKHFAYQPDKEPCPQLSIIEVLGDLYFGAVNHVEELIFDHAEKHPEQRFLLLRLHHVNTCDFSGIHMLESVVRSYRERGGDVFLVRPNYHVYQMICSTRFEEFIGANNILDDDEAISHLFHRVLDPAVCIYECPVRAFKECQNLPKRIIVSGIPLNSDIPEERIMSISPEALWQQLHNGVSANSGMNGSAMLPMVVDVREPREFKRGHIAEAKLVPLPSVLSADVKFPADRQIVLVCRSGRRSRRAASALQSIGCMNVSVLQGGMLAWEAAGLLEAIE